MYRYIAFSWNSRDPAKTAVAQRLTRLLLSTSIDWEGVFDVPGLRVFHVPQPGGACHAYTLKRDGGVVLGKLFDGDHAEDRIPHDPTFDDKESEKVIESQGRCLVERYWGHYVAFMRTRGGEVRYVLRDPTGGLQCYLMKVSGIDVILSDMEDCVRLSLTPLTVDWDHVTAYFLHTRLVTRTTGFTEVTQLYAGECAAIVDDDKDDRVTTKVTRSFYWDPATVCEARLIEDPDEARAALRGVIRHCVNAWASSYDRIALELSGGLDSSIVAACLANASVRPEVLCLHYFTEMAEGDERSYAQAAARSTGFELIESEARTSERTLEKMLNRSRFATPAMLGFVPAPELLKRRLVTERHAGAVFSGQGGDHLFQQEGTKLIAAEYVHRHGLRPQVLRVAKDTSRLTSQSIWSVLRAAIRYGRLGRSFDPYGFHFQVPSFLSKDARAQLRPQAYTHPWVTSASRLPASKIRQIFNVVDCQPFYRMDCPNAEQVHPLISQPIIELCLQVPTYVLTHRGRSRGLVREAFEADVPKKIIRRQIKGQTTSYFGRILVENAAYIRELLLDGVLVSEGVLDRRELEKLLSERELILGKGLNSILPSIMAEAWLSTWAEQRQRTAA